MVTFAGLPVVKRFKLNGLCPHHDSKKIFFTSLDAYISKDNPWEM